TPPLTIARTTWRFGSKRRGLTLLAWLCCRPTTGLLPQTSHCLAICKTPIIAGCSGQDQTRRGSARRFGVGAIRLAPIGPLDDDPREQIEVAALIVGALPAQLANRFRDPPQDQRRVALERGTAALAGFREHRFQRQRQPFG